MPKRVAMTIAGAVSLGSYEAGVTYELLEAIRQHNVAMDGPTGDPDGKIYVDVITGASAGGMTAAMLGQWLMFRGDAMQDAAGNPLYHAWVKRISLAGLVKLKKTENPWHSLLSSDLVTTIGAEMLVESIQQPATGAHACLEPGANLRIGVALTNLNGVDYKIPIEGSDEGGFNYTRSVDQRLFTIDPKRPLEPRLRTPDGMEQPAGWDHVRDAAVACGAFPFGFRPQQIQREKQEYINEVTPEWPTPPEKGVPGTTYVTPSVLQPWSFAYTDGGVLQNQPLGIAKDLVDVHVSERLSHVKARLASLHAAGHERDKAAAEVELGKIHRDADDRLYVFISPNEVKSSAADLVAADISLVGMLRNIVGVYFRQAAFHDWILAERVNQKIQILDERAKELAQALVGGKITDVGAFETAASNLDDLLLGPQLPATLERLGHQYSALCSGMNAEQQSAFVHGIAALEAAARLGDQDKMHIVAVLADGKKELAGSGIAAFVGFFSETYREHDYRVGRTKAREYLLRKDVSRLLGLDTKALQERFDASPIAPMDPPLTVPVSMGTALEAGARWLRYAVWIRVRGLVSGVAGLGLVVYLIVALVAHWWPFRHCILGR